MNFVKAARMKLKMTQQQLADAIGVKRQTVGEWEGSGPESPGDLSRAKIQSLLDGIRSEVTGSVGHARETPEHYRAEPNPLTHPTMRPHGHFRRLHEQASADQRKFLAQLMLDAIVANANDLREILELEETTAEPPGKRELEERLAKAPAPSPADAELHRKASATVIADAARVAREQAKRSAPAPRKRA